MVHVNSCKREICFSSKQKEGTFHFGAASIISWLFAAGLSLSADARNGAPFFGPSWIVVVGLSVTDRLTHQLCQLFTASSFFFRSPVGRRSSARQQQQSS